MARALACTAFTSLAFGAVFAQSPIFSTDIQLRGMQAKESVELFVAPTDIKAIELDLRWSTSAVIDGKRSFVNILVNGQVRSTRRVADLNEEPWRIAIRPLEPGRHQLGIQAHLRGKEEECTPMPEALWITLLNTSSMKGVTKASKDAAEKQVAVRDFPSLWKAQSFPSRSGAASGVTIVHDFEWNEQTYAAWLRALHFLMQQKIEAQTIHTGEPPEPAQPRLSLRRLDRLPSGHPAAKRWAAAPDTNFVLHAASRSELEIVAKTPDQLLNALDLMDSDERRQTCHASVCSVSDADAAGSLLRRAAVRQDLWSMAKGDQPRGWTAKGVGAHQLRQVWVRPLGAEFQKDVFLHLVARASRAEQIDKEQSSINVSVNDQPLATYSLSNWNSPHAKIRIPSSLWTARVWVIDFEARLIPKHAAGCSFLVSEDYWLTVDPETQVEAAYSSKPSTGISGFWQRAMDEPMLRVSWIDAAGSAPSENQLAQFAPVLQSFQRSAASGPSPRLSFVVPDECAAQPCIRLHPHRGAYAPGENVLLWKTVLPGLAEKAANLPDLGGKGTAVISLQKTGDTAPEQLHVLLGEKSQVLVPAPDMTTFAGNIALHTDQWQFFSDHVAVQNNIAATRIGPANSSEQQGRLRWVNLIWALGSLLVIVVFAITYWRKKRTPDPKTWEIQ